MKINWNMLKTKYIWQNGQLIDWDNAYTHVLTHALHYGSAVFEGVRFYETPKGPAIFRLKEHTDRLFYSAGALGMDIPYTKDEINQAIIEVVKTSGEKSGYIRPLAYYGAGKMGLNPTGSPVDVIIACWPWGKYLGDEKLKVCISKYIRIHPQSTISDAKIAGHYINSILTSFESHKKGFHEALLLDFEGNIAEGPGENFFMVKDKKLYTVPLGRILNGITRASIIKLAQDEGIEVIERHIGPEEAKAADELFYTGTAAEISAISQLDDTVIGNSGEEGNMTRMLREKFYNIVEGRDDKYADWLTLVD